MGLLNSALQIGRSALLSYQGALHVVGNNISSAGSPDYTRLTPQLDPLQGSTVLGEQHPGAGVALSGIQRNIDEALEGRIRLAIGTAEAATAERDTLTRVQNLFDDTNGAGISARMTDFFNSFNDLQNRPEDNGVRELAIQNGVTLAQSFQNTVTQLTSLAADLDGQIAGVVANADDLARKIGELNSEITTVEAGGAAQATGLRDQRDAVLRDLSLLFDVTAREQSDGAVNVYAGSEALVQGSAVRGLIAVPESDGEAIRTSMRFADTNQQVAVRGGRLAGLIAGRDQLALGRVARIDELAAAFIATVNRIHADGQGLVGFTQVEGTNDVLATDVSLRDSAAGLDQPPQNGSFFVTVADDATGVGVSHRIDVQFDGDTPTTLETLVADINERDMGVTASITGDRRIALQAADGFTFTLGQDGERARPDTSGVLAALGVNTLFTGHNARDMAVNKTVQQDDRLLAAASNFIAGDGSTALQIAELSTAANGDLGGASLPDSYNAVVTSIAVAGSAARDTEEAAAAISASLQAQKERISGVSLDEEAISLVKYERAFQGASRFVGVVNNLLNELILLVR